MSGALVASAALAPLTPPPSGGYDVGTNSILDPGCNPGDTNCFVKNPLPTGGSAGQMLTTNGAGVYSWTTPTTGWGLSGNVGTTAGTDFIGTTDNQDLVMKTNGGEKWRITSGKGRFITPGPTTGEFIMGIGVGNETSTGLLNTLVGALNGRFLTTGSYNTSVGQSSLRSLTTGSENIAMGYFSMRESITANQNVGIGIRSLYFNQGNLNTSLGHRSGEFISTGSNNITIGANTNIPTGTASNQMNIGNLIYGTGMSGSLAGNIGIGTTTPNNKLEITQGTAGNSGLRFTNLLSTSTPITGNGKFLTVSSNGDVVLSDGNGALKWYAENATAPSTAPVATGTNSIAIGDNAEALSSDMIVLGSYAGQTATNAQQSNFIGLGAGWGAVNTQNSNFIGTDAGASTSVVASNFIGQYAGLNAINAYNSNFIGPSAGESADNAANSIFIGAASGQGDTVDNTGFINNYSILLGNYINTGGFSNSVLIGSGTQTAADTNTLSNQFKIANRLTDFMIRGVNYQWPTTQAATAGDVLSNDGTGILSWITPPSGGLQYFKDNGGTPSTVPIATGTNSIAIDNGAYAVESEMLVFGTNAATSIVGPGFTRTGPNAIVIGKDAVSIGSTGSGSVVDDIIAIGREAGNYTYRGDYGVNIGYQAGGGGDTRGSVFVGPLSGNQNNGGTGTESVFIGSNAGSTTSGSVTHSIAIGTNALATANNQFVVGGTGTGNYWGGTTGIDTTIITATNGNTCTIDSLGATGIACTSDERLKENVADLSNASSLEKVLNMRTVSYNYIKGNHNRTIGFLAQDVEKYIPEVVITDPNGYKAVSYGNMTPVIISAIKELNLKVDESILNSGNANSTGFFDSLRTWLGNAGNGLEKLFAKEVQTSKLCVDDICVTRDQFMQMVNGTSGSSSGTTGSGSGSNITDSGNVTNGDSGTPSSGDTTLVGDATESSTSETDSTSATDTLSDTVTPNETPTETVTTNTTTE
jgi:hypothetical protein